MSTVTRLWSKTKLVEDAFVHTDGCTGFGRLLIIAFFIENALVSKATCVIGQVLLCFY
jgi:hypothetical protein